MLDKQDASAIGSPAGQGLGSRDRRAAKVARET